MNAGRRAIAMHCRADRRSHPAETGENTFDPTNVPTNLPKGA